MNAVSKEFKSIGMKYNVQDGDMSMEQIKQMMYTRRKTKEMKLIEFE
jgi:hypothetical protein